MKSHRSSVGLALVVALVAIVALIIWWTDRAVPLPTVPQVAATADAPVQGATGATTDPVAAPTDATAAAERTVVPLDPSAPQYVVRGRVLADARASLRGAEVLAYAGKAGERGGFLAMMNAGGGRREDLSFLTSGPVLAREPVAADGTFALTTNQPHLRLALEHDLYGLSLPEIVHVPAAARSIEVVLAPYLGGCIRGRLLGGDPKQIEAIRLSVSPDPMSVVRDPQAFLGTIARSAQSPERPDANGRFVFRAVSASGAITLTAEGKTATGRARQNSLEPGEVREVALPIAAALRAQVQVVDEAGAPVAAVRVVATADEPQNQAARIHGAARAETDAAGKATLEGLAPGPWRVRAAKSEFASTSQAIDLPFAGVVTLTLRRGATIRGIVVTTDGTPIAEAQVGSLPSIDVPMFGDMTAQLGPDLLATIAREGVTTAADGTFTLSGLDDEGQCNVVAAAAEHTPAMALAVRPGSTDVRIELQRASALRVRAVADEDGTPIADFAVELRTTMFLMIDRAVVTAEATAAADGTLAMANLPTGDFTLAVAAEGRSETTQSVHLVAGAEPTMYELRLVRAASIRGRVVDPDGRGVAGAIVQRSRGGMRDNPMLVMLQGEGTSVRTDANGAFTLGGLQPGRVQLHATAEGFAGGKSERIEVVAGGTTADVVIALDHGGSIEGLLRTVRGEAVEEFTVLAQNEATQKSTTCSPDQDGRFRIDNLDPGRYQVQAMHPSALRMMRGAGDADPGRPADIKGMIARVSDSTVSQRCTVRAGAATNVELDASDLGSGTRLSLRVTIGGEPLDSGIVECTHLEDGRVRIGFLTDGQATFGALRPGQVRVQVRTGMTMAPVGGPQLVEVPLGIDHHRMTVELPGGSISGRVTDPEGKPLAAVLVRLLRGSAGGDDDRFGSAITDASGAFTFRALEPDTYGLVAADSMLQRSDAAAASRVDDIRVGDGEHRTGVELHAQPAVGATVTVTDEQGSPVAGATVVAVGAEGSPLGNFALAVTGSDGKAHLGGLPRGSLRVVGRADGLAPDASAPVEALPGQSFDVALRLPRGTRTTLEARGRDGQPLAGAEVRARCNGGPWLPSLLLLEGRSREGRFELGRLAAGNWEFRIEHPGVGTFTVARAIGDGAAVTILATPAN